MSAKVMYQVQQLARDMEDVKAALQVVQDELEELRSSQSKPSKVELTLPNRGKPNADVRSGTR